MSYWVTLMYSRYVKNPVITPGNVYVEAVLISTCAIICAIVTSYTGEGYFLSSVHASRTLPVPALDNLKAILQQEGDDELPHVAPQGIEFGGVAPPWRYWM